jgi:hypothetical protein
VGRSVILAAMPGTTESRKNPLPFYGSFASFERVIAYWKADIIPRRIDSASLAAITRDEAPRIVSGFKSLSWIDEDYHATDDLRMIVDSYREESWQKTFSGILRRAYAFIPDKWDELTPERLHTAFVNHAGRDIGAVRSAETFFIAAAASAAIRLSSGLANRTPRLRVKRAAKVINSEEPGMAQNGGDNIKAPASTPAVDQILDLLALIDEIDMTEKEKMAVLTVMSYLRRSAATKAAKNAA